MALVFQCCCKWRAPGKRLVLAAILGVLLTASSAQAAFYDGYDWEVQKWAQTTDPGGSTGASGVGYNGQTLWMKSVRNAGLRGLVMRANLVAGKGVSGSPSTGTPLTPLVRDFGTTDSSAGAMTYSETNGLSASFIKTSFNPTNFTANDAGMAIYMGGTAGAEAQIVMGCSMSSGDFFMTTSYSALGQAADIWTSTGRPAVADTDGRGFYLASRTSSAATGVAVYRNGALTGTSSSVGGSPPNTSASADPTGIGIMAFNTDAGFVGQSTFKLRGYQVTRGLTASQVTLFYTFWQRYNGPSMMNRDWTK